MTLPIQTFKEYMTRWLGGTTPNDISKAGKVAKEKLPTVQEDPSWATPSTQRRSYVEVVKTDIPQEKN